jgi:hypothetical protein
MRGLEETFAGNTLTRPTAIEPRQPLLIKPDGTGATGNSADKPAMDHGQHGKNRDRDQQQEIRSTEVAKP